MISSRVFRAASLTMLAVFPSAFGQETSIDGFREVVAGATKDWMDAVVVRSDPEAVAELFCDDGLLVATAGVGIRMQNSSETGWGAPKPEGTTIQSYFDWFATLPDQDITSHHNNIQQVDDDVWVNNAWVHWTWAGNPGLVARMSFVFRQAPAGLCIFELHSSQLPERPESRRLRGGPPAADAVVDDTPSGAGKDVKFFTQVEDVTSAWMNAVVNKSDPKAISDLFCDDGVLVATAGVGLRMQTGSEDGWGMPKTEGTTIKSYFEWFATLPEQAVTASHNNIAQVTETVWINNAWVNWAWSGNPGLTARMTFIVRAEPAGACIFMLHSSQLPEN